MRSIGAADARTQLYHLLDRVSAGESITITKRGTPVARLVPVAATASKADEVLREMRALRKGNTLGGVSIRELIDEGRK